MFKSNLVKGIAAKVLAFLITAFAGLLFTPYLLSRIGVEAYAFFPLSFNIISYASVFTVLFTSVLSKFITVHYHSGNYRDMNEVFNSSLKGSFVVGIFAIIPLILISLFADRIFDIPSGLLTDVKILFMTLTAAFFVVQIRTPFTVANIATGKRYLTTLQRFFEKLLIIIIPVLLFNILRPSLVYLGAGVLIAVILRTFITIKTQRRIMPELILEKEYVSNRVAKTVVLSGIWYLVVQLTLLLGSNIESVLINLFFGYDALSDYAPAVIFPNFIKTMVIVITNYFLPHLALLSENENYTELKKSIPSFVKCMSAFMAVTVSVVIGFGDVLLKIWIGKFMTPEMYTIMVLSLISVFVTGSFSVLYSILVIRDKIRLPAVIMLVLGILNIPLSLIFSFGFGIYGVLISTLVISFAGYTVFIPVYSKKVLKFRLKKIYSAFLSGGIILIIGIALSDGIKIFFGISDVMELITALIAVIVVLIAVIFTLVFKKDDFKFIGKTVRATAEYSDEINKIREKYFDNLTGE